MADNIQISYLMSKHTQTLSFNNSKCQLWECEEVKEEVNYLNYLYSECVESFKYLICAFCVLRSAFIVCFDLFRSNTETGKWGEIFDLLQ